MGKIESCKITFGDKTKPVYRTGDTIFGKVTLQVQGEISINAVIIYCYGAAFTKWSTSDQRVGDSDHRSKESYISKQLVLYTGKGNSTATLTEGKHIYNYRFQLPNDQLPSSFEGSLGAVRYWLKVRVDKTFPGIDHSDYFPFTVLSDINTGDSASLKPVSKNAHKIVSKVLGLGNAGTLHLSASLDKSAYICGENILITLDAKNQSTKNLGWVRARLVQRVWYTVGVDNDIKTTVVSTIQSEDRLGKEDSMLWNNRPLEIPAVPPSTLLRSCHIIKVSYNVEVEVVVPAGFDLNLSLPVTIGTIPVGVTKSFRKLQHADCSDYFRVCWSKSITHKTCTAGFTQCYKTDSDMPFPHISFKPSTIILTPGETDTPSTAATTTTTTNKTAAAEKQSNLESISTASAATASSSGEMAILPNEAPPSYDSLYCTETSALSAPSTPNAQHTQSTPDTQSLDNDSTPSSTPIEQSTDSTSTSWNGAVLGLIFPEPSLSVMNDFMKRDIKMLEGNDGTVMATFEKFQITPPNPKSAIFVIFSSEAQATTWADHLRISNPQPDLQIFLAENSSPNASAPTNSKLFPCTVVVMTAKNTEETLTEQQNADFTNLTKTIFPSLRQQYGGRVVISATRVKYITDNWEANGHSADNISISVRQFPSQDHYQEYINGFKAHPDHDKYKAISDLRSSLLISSSTMYTSKE